MDPSDAAGTMKQVARLWSKSQPAVAAFVAGAVTDFHDAEDVVAEVAETIVAKHADFEPTKPFVPWAMGVAKIQILRYYRQRAGEKFLRIDAAALDAVVAAHGRMSTDEVPARLDALRACVRKVQGKARRVMDLHYSHGLGPDAVAEALDMTRNAVWVTLHRVREALRKCVEERLAQAGEAR